MKGENPRCLFKHKKVGKGPSYLHLKMKRESDFSKITVKVLFIGSTA